MPNDNDKERAVVRIHEDKELKNVAIDILCYEIMDNGDETLFMQTAYANTIIKNCTFSYARRIEELLPSIVSQTVNNIDWRVANAEELSN